MPPLGLRLEIKSRPPTFRQLEIMHREAGWLTSPEKLREILQSSGTRWLYAVLSEKMVGIARVLCYGKDLCFISDLIVKKKMRGMGVGTFLLKGAEVLCRDDGVAIACLEPTGNSEAFYFRNGYSWSPVVTPTLFKDFRGKDAAAARTEHH